MARNAAMTGLMVATTLVGPLSGVGVWSSNRAMAALPPGADGSGAVDEEVMSAEVSFENAQTSPCRWQQFSGVDPRSGRRIEHPLERVHNGRRQVLFQRDCGTAPTFHWIDVEAPQRMVEKARGRASDVIPRLLWRSAPSIDRQVVTIGTWFWVPKTLWKPIAVTATVATSVGPLSVTVTATPTHLIYAPGDGDRPTVCRGPGRPWRRVYGDRATTECMHVHHMPSHVRESGTFTARTSVQWALSWSSNFGASGRLPNVRLGFDQRATVLELQALAT